MGKLLDKRSERERERGASKQRNQPVRSIGATQTSPVQMCGGSPLFHWPLSMARVIALLLFGPRASKDKIWSFQFLKWRNSPRVPVVVAAVVVVGYNF